MCQLTGADVIKDRLCDDSCYDVLHLFGTGVPKPPAYGPGSGLGPVFMVPALLHYSQHWLPDPPADKVLELEFLMSRCSYYLQCDTISLIGLDYTN